MKKIITLFALFLSFSALAQTGYWQQKLYYTIDISLNDKDKTITGKETVIYKNNSPETLDYVWFHIWPNAYNNENTALYQQIKNDASRKKKLETSSRGSIDGLAFTVNGKTAATEPHTNPSYIDIIKVKLPQPLKPGDSASISTPFTVKLPNYFSRSGFADDEFMICQWYPKPAVYDKTGWHEMPYLDMGEFYSEYADYKVNITLPSEYVVAATGEMNNADELAQYKELGSKNAADRSARIQYQPKQKDAVKTLTYTASNVPDFAWFAEKGFIIQYDTLQLASGKLVDAFSYYHNKKNTLWNNSIDYVKEGARYYSNLVGEYEYPVVQAVEGPKNNSSGGMEYPMVTLITSPDAKTETLDAVIAHEVGHNWFMSMLGSNERMHTWQDEGLNTYYQFRYEAEKYRSNMIFGDAIPADIKKLPLDKFQEAVYGAVSSIPMQSAIKTAAADFKTSDEYGLISYVKTALWMYMLESALGREKIDDAFKFYFQTWKHKHPQPEDMQAAFEQSTGAKLDRYFDLLKKEGAFE